MLFRSISYMHATWGHSGSFPEKEKTAITQGVKALRMFVEGRLKIPDTGLQLGFDANLGDEHQDVRFLVGTRFDIGQLIGRLQHF